MNFTHAWYAVYGGQQGGDCGRKSQPPSLSTPLHGSLSLYLRKCQLSLRARAQSQNTTNSLASFRAGGKQPSPLSQSQSPHEKLGNVIRHGSITQKQLPLEELPCKWVNFRRPEKVSYVEG